MSVGYQMMYEDGNTGGVFRAALMQSGSPSTYAALPASYPPRQAAYDFVTNATGCVGGNFECLRNADDETLKQANYDVFKLPLDLVSLDPYPTAVGPTLSSGDPFLSRPPRQTIQEGKFAKVPFVCGTNLDEGTLFTTNPNTTQELVTFLTTQLPGLTFGTMNTTIVEQLLNYYPTDPGAGSPYNTGNNTFGKATQYKRAASVIGDLIFEASRRDFLQAATKLGFPSWSYQFAQTGLTPDLPELGVAHASEILFVVQYLPEQPQSHLELGAEIIDYWCGL
ncbi:extracellular triacylglycerol lipase precursor [Rhizoctonia solani AG-1 IB]|uniref:Extracellular triacylglycerol lipase n=1 Tax=Thanatephorus cucumeris (strain AG1-IB / isolate 7/3/14) TaxID=1108050 RepID=M5BTU1_THACB|nr:extracellular triacylglycerol lipase precursor [Rhizoctonia solani AG-1 IB]